MDDLGAPTSYLALERGVDVYDSAGEAVGTVDHILAAEAQDIFDGLVIDARGPLGGHRFADAEQIDELYERGVVLKVAAAELHEPSENAASLAVDPDDTADSPLTARLRRAWDWISGNY